MGAINYSVRSPIGVAGLISPWNLPIYLLTFKIAPAIAAGNTVVCKPSEMTSVTAWMMAKVLNEAGTVLSLIGSAENQPVQLVMYVQQSYCPVEYVSSFHINFLGSQGGLMVSVLDSRVRGPGSSPCRGHCAVFLGKILYSHSASLHPGVKMGTSELLGKPNKLQGSDLRWTSMPSRESNRRLPCGRSQVQTLTGPTLRVLK